MGTKSRGFEYLLGGELAYVDMPRSLTVNNSEAYNAAALAGLGIVQVLRVGIEHQLQQGALRTNFSATCCPAQACQSALRQSPQPVTSYTSVYGLVGGSR